MANDAYILQGRNGLDVVGGGETFTGRSAGLLVAEDAAVQFQVLKPDGSSAATVTLTAAPAGFFPGGTITSVVVSTGQVIVYPESTNYTIV